MSFFQGCKCLFAFRDVNVSLLKGCKKFRDVNVSELWFALP